MDEGDKASMSDWCSDIMRIGKLFMVENDPECFDNEFWMDYFNKTKVDCINICAGGIVAFYPTKIPFHRKSAWIGETDSFGELVKAAKSRNLKVIARIDPHATHQEACEAHPEWIAVDENGNKRRHWSNPELWVTCVLGTYYTEFLSQVVREITSEYMVDGFHINRWEGSGICYCENCKKEFKAFSGMEIPKKSNPKDMAWEKYNEWVRIRLLNIWDYLEHEVNKINPKGHFLPNNIYHPEVMGAREVAERARMINVDYQARTPKTPIWNIGRVAKKVRSVVGNVPVIAGISPGFEDSNRWKDSVRDKSEMKMWYVDAIANGMRIGWGKFSAKLYDTRWLKPVEDIFEWHYKYNKYMVNIKSEANIAVVWTQLNTLYHEDGTATKESEDHDLGMYHALMESRVPFEMIDSEFLDAKHMESFKLIVFPNICRLSDEQCDAIREYVRKGGSIMATYETSLYDEHGKQRENFGLADVFGVDFKSNKKGLVRNSYINLEADPVTGKYHDILDGFTDAGRIINGTLQLEVNAVEKFLNPPLTLVPSYPDLPMEDVFPRYPRTDIPQVFLQEVGVSRVIYFPWDIDRVFWEVMCLEHCKLLGNCAKWGVKGEVPVSVSGPGLVDVTVWSQANSMTVHIVNLSNPMTMNGSYHELIPIGAQKLKIAVPQSRKVVKVSLLVSEGSLDFEKSEGFISITVPNIIDHEVIAVDFE